MKTFLWWLKKEAREHRALLVLLALAVPLGSWLMVHLTRGRPPTPNELRLPSQFEAPTIPGVAADPKAGPFPHRLHRTEWEALLLVSAALAAAAVAGGLFAAESRRGMTTLMARTPGAWRAAFGAKIVFLGLLLAGTLLLHGVVLGRLAVVYDLVDGYGTARALVDEWILLPRGELLVLYGSFLALAAWVLLASASLPLIGVPVLVGTVVGIGAAVPGLVWTDKYPFFFRWWVGGHGWALAVAAAVALALLTLVWFRWGRFMRSAKFVGLRVAFLALLCIGAGNGVAWSAVTRYTDFGADAPDLRLEDVVIGPGNRFAYVQAYRGDPDAADEPEFPRFERRGTPASPWRVDLGTGASVACGGPREEWTPDYGFGGIPRQLPRALMFIDDRDVDPDSGTWFDARTGERLGRGYTTSRPAGAIDRVREVLRSETGVRDSEGRRAWILDGHLEREGVDRIPLGEDLGNLLEIPGGWAEGHLSFGHDGPAIYVRPHTNVHSIDADTGRIRKPRSPSVAGHSKVISWWDPRHLLITHSVAGELEHDVSRDVWQMVPLERVQILDLERGAVAPLRTDLSAEVAKAVPLARVGPDALLLRGGAPGTLTFSRWMRTDGTTQRVAWDGAELESIEFVEAVGEGKSMPRLVPVGGPVVLQAWRSEPAGWVREGRRGGLSGFPQDQRFRMFEAWLVYDPAKNVLRVLRDWNGTDRAELVRIQPDGAVIALEANRRIVRLGPEAGRREVLFPKR